MAFYLSWDDPGERLYETGVKMGVLYPYDASANDATKVYGPGVAWNGLSSVSESPSGAESNPIYADDIKYLDIRSREEFGATIEAYTFPDAWYECDGGAKLGDLEGVIVGQQSRNLFGLCYRTVLGNDQKYENYAYKLHLIYGATASPSEKQYSTINDSPEAMTMSWELTTTPIDTKLDTLNDNTIPPLKPTAIITIDSRNFQTTAAKTKLAALEAKLYGTAAVGSGDPVPAYLPLPLEVYTTLKPTT